MLSKKDKEEILRLRQEESLSYKEIHKKIKFSITTIMNVCKEKIKEVEQPKTVNTLQSSSIPKDVLEEAKKIIEKRHKDEIIEEYWKEYLDPLFDSGEWLIKEIHNNEINELSAEHRKEFSRFKNNYERKMQNLQTVNQKLNEDNSHLQTFIDNRLDDAGRREKFACVKEQNRIEQERYDFDLVCMEKQNRIEQERYDFDQSVDKQRANLNNRQLELVQRDKDQNKRNDEQDERDKKLSELQKLLDDQADKQRIERKEITQDQDRAQKLLDDQVVKQQIKDSELKQKKYELEQKKDAIIIVKKDLMGFAGEIGRELLELSIVEQKIERNKHFLFLTGEHEKVLERISLS